MEKFPSISVITPFLGFDFSTTFTPIRGSEEESVTLPVTLNATVCAFYAATGKVANNKTKHRKA